jgi:hypothetical protein
LAPLHVPWVDEGREAPTVPAVDRSNRRDHADYDPEGDVLYRHVGLPRPSGGRGHAPAVAVYQRIADEVLERADRRAYRSAARILQRAQVAALAADELAEFGEYLAHLRERHLRRPTLIAIPDKANLR